MVKNKIKFYGLGSFYFEYQEKKIDGNNWNSKRALYLLMYLLLKKNRCVSVEELVDIFWEESDLEDGKNKLYNTIYLLRKSLVEDGIPKDIIKSANGGYLINKNYDIWTDWDYFENKTNQMLNQKKLKIEELRELYNLYRGDFFSDLRYEEWIEIEREKLRENYLNLIEIISNKLYNKQKFRDTVNYLHQGIKYDPYRENFYLLYIKALVKLDRIAEAINSYKKCEQILREELDVLPGQELKNEYHKIKFSREVSGSIEDNLIFENNYDLGAMICNVNMFKKIYQLEFKHTKRQKTKFVLLKINFSGVSLPISFSEAAVKMSFLVRACDVICVSDQRIYLLLRDMKMINSGIIMNRINSFCEKLKLKNKPSVDIKEIC